jgi:peptidoglycan/LPS O-acetylase OafA/YrhL
LKALQPGFLQPFFGIDAVPGYAGRTAESRYPHVPGLSGVRGLAIILVIAGHFLERVDRFYSRDHALTGIEKIGFYVLARPFSGCCLFFAISGYTLLLFLARRNPKQDEASVASYSRRRVLRLCPPYFIVIASTYLFLEITGYVPTGTNQFAVKPDSLTQSLLTSLTLSHDLVFGTFPRLFPPGWFIESQVQFYLICPVIWLAYLRLGHPRARLYIGVSLLLLFVTGSTLLTAFGPARLHYSVLAFLPYFWVGALVADYHISFVSTHPVAGRSHAELGWWSFAFLVALGAPIQNEGLQVFARLVCVALMLDSCSRTDGHFRKTVMNRWMIRLGVASYSVYLVHLQVLQVVTPAFIRLVHGAPLVLVTVACGLADLLAVAFVSTLFYWLVERPWLAVALTRLKAARATMHTMHLHDGGPGLKV